MIRPYESALRARVPNVTLKLGAQVLPMVSAPQFYSFCGSVVLLDPKSPSPSSGQPGVRWSYVELVKAAAAFRHVVRGERAAFDSGWTPRMGVFRAGTKRVCTHGSLGKSRLLLIDVRSFCAKAATSAARL